MLFERRVVDPRVSDMPFGGVSDMPFRGVSTTGHGTSAFPVLDRVGGKVPTSLAAPISVSKSLPPCSAGHGLPVQPWLWPDRRTPPPTRPPPAASSPGPGSTRWRQSGGPARPRPRSPRRPRPGADRQCRRPLRVCHVGLGWSSGRHMPPELGQLVGF